MRNRALAAAVVIAVAAVAATLLRLNASSSREEAVRDIRVVVRDMTFYVDGGSEPNPTIALRAGERVRFHVRSEDAGMRHDFSVKAWNVATRTLDEKGAEDAVTFRVPGERGATSYVCTPHAAMMSGTLRIE